MAESVKVIVRCRPMNGREKGLNCKTVVFMDPAIMQCSLVNAKDDTAPPKNFTFDGAYGTNSTTETIYNEIAYPLVEGVLEGYNGTVFAYGQTGCGKSFTMQGVKDPASQRGIIPRTFEHIFEAIDSSENMKYLVHASYLEIYNEDIRDLLGKDVKRKLNLKQHPDKGVYVEEISLHPVHNTTECERLMELGWSNRATGATKMNAESSRSHSIFTINIEMMDTRSSGGQHIRKGKLNLVDLAGSERQAKTEATGDRLKEANKINLSLSALGNVISALVDGKMKHIPYRDSKLTRLLQDSLGGNTKTMMVACLSPADNNYDETLSTLRYANRAKNIKNKPKINEDPKDAMLREYQQEIQKLKAMLDQHPGGGTGTTQALSEQLLEEERQRMRSEHEHEMAELRNKMESEKQTKAAMQNEIELMKKQYEDKMKDLESRAAAGATVTSTPGTVGGRGMTGAGSRLGTAAAAAKGLGTAQGHRQQQQDSRINKMQQEAMTKLKQLQEEMIDGGKRAGDKNLKERRKQKKKAAENRIKALGEALGHVDDEDGVLLKVYDDIQEELKVKTEALKKSKQKVKALTTEIKDIQQEFERDRGDLLETIREQEQKLILLQQILEKVQPTIRKDCNYSNLQKIQDEAVWNDETQRWRIPDLITQKTKLPPAGSSSSLLATAVRKAISMEKKNGHSNSDETTLEEIEDDWSDQQQHLQQKLAKSEEEDFVGNYFGPQRANRIMEQAQETKRNGGLSKPSSTNSTTLAASNLTSNANLSSSVNSGLNTFGLNNSYTGASSTSSLRTGPSSIANGHGAPYTSDFGNFRKPSRLEALPTVDRNKNNRKKSGPPLLNTMGTF